MVIFKGSAGVASFTLLSRRCSPAPARNSEKLRGYISIDLILPNPKVGISDRANSINDPAEITSNSGIFS